MDDYTCPKCGATDVDTLTDYRMGADGEYDEFWVASCGKCGHEGTIEEFTK